VIARPQKNREEMLLRTQHESFAEELAERFNTWRVPGRYEELRGAFADRSAAGLADQFGRVEALLQGLEHTAEESLGLAGSLVFGEARERAERPRRVCEQHAERG
jgi:hypothetical protein